MNLLPLRLSPGSDLRRGVEETLRHHAHHSAFVLSGIGSLAQTALRFAGMEEGRVLSEPVELLSLAGSVSQHGAHLHMSIATASGQVLGGHVGYGNTVRTTVELLIAFLSDWQLSREHDPETGYKELVVRRPGREANP